MQIQNPVACDAEVADNALRDGARRAHDVVAHLLNPRQQVRRDRRLELGAGVEHDLGVQQVELGAKHERGHPRLVEAIDLEEPPEQAQLELDDVAKRQASEGADFRAAPQLLPRLVDAKSLLQGQTAGLEDAV